MLTAKMAIQARFVQRPHSGHSRRAGLVIPCPVAETFVGRAMTERAALRRWPANPIAAGTAIRRRDGQRSGELQRDASGAASTTRQGQNA